jgi:hypothetical protein
MAVVEELMSGPQLSHKPPLILWVLISLGGWGVLAMMFAMIFRLMFPV